MKLLKQKQTEAAQRQAVRAKRSNTRQLELLNKRPGQSAREKARLAQNT